MPTLMTMPPLDLVPEGTEGSQRVAVMDKPGSLVIRHARIPEPRDNEIRIKICYNGICGSDLEAYRGTRAPEFMSFPLRLGHEVSGVIDKVGSTVVGLKVGDAVTTRYVWGALAQYIVCKPFNVKVLPPAFPMIEISLIEVLPGVIHAAELAKVTPHSRVLIMGQGVSGLVLTQVFKLYSPAVLAVTDLKDRNLALGKKYGATHAYKLPHAHASTMEAVKADFPDGFDIVVPCLLEGDGMRDALDCCSLGAKIIMYGCIGTCASFDFFKMHRRRVEIYSTEPRRDIDMRRYFDEGVKMVLDGVVNTSEMVTHIFPLSRVQDAFQLRNQQVDASTAGSGCASRCGMSFECTATTTAGDHAHASDDAAPAGSAAAAGTGGAAATSSGSPAASHAAGSSTTSSAAALADIPGAAEAIHVLVNCQAFDDAVVSFVS